MRRFDDVAGKVIVVGPEAATPASQWLAAGAVVVVAGSDAAAVGGAVRALGERAASAGPAQEEGAAVAGFVGGPDDPALGELIGELFPGAERIPPPPG